jgi:ABC-2 type transport system permease protein
VTWTRVRALLRKELADVARNRAALAPVAIVAAISLLIPFVIAVGIPALTGEPLSRDADMAKLAGRFVAGAALTPEARVQTFLFQQFLLLFLMTPVTGAMALAAYAIIGEKQARTLEPLLATPITTAELLVAKVLGALLPTVAITVATLALYALGLVFLAEPGVAAAVATARTMVLVCLVGLGVALAALQLAVLVSSRVNDPRTAQQFGVLIIIPIVGVLAAQFTGALWLTAGALALVAAGLFALWIVLTMVSVAVFDRETILTRWK